MLENQTQDQAEAIAFSALNSDSLDFKKISPEQRTQFLLRLFAASGDSVSDCELLMLIISNAAPQADSRALAIRLLERFGDFGSALCADMSLLQTIEGVDDAVLHAFAMMRTVAQRMAKTTIIDQTVLGSWSALMEYLKLKISYNSVEEFHVLFMNQRQVLLADEKMNWGTVNHTPIYVREIVKRALEVGASGIILFHNKTSDDPTPTKSNLETTLKIVEACSTVGITVHDHVIVTKSGHFSFKSFNML